MTLSWHWISVISQLYGLYKHHDPGVDYLVCHPNICWNDTADTRRSPNAGTMLGQRRRRWTSIVPALGERLVFAGEGHKHKIPIILWLNEMKWNEWGFRPPLCTYRLNWARRTSWGWWDDWDDTVLQTQDSKFEPWWSEAEHATSRSRRLPHNTNFHTWMGKKHFLFFLNRRDREPNPELWRERQRC